MLNKSLVIALTFCCSGMLVAQATVVPLYEPAAKTITEALTPFDAAMRDAFDRMNKKDLTGARTLLDRALAINPKSIDAHLARAELERLANQPAEIEAALKRAQTIDANSPDVLAAWARWYFAKSDFKSTEDYLRRALQAKPDYARLHIDLGDLYLNALHDAVSATSAYRRAIELAPKSAGAHAGLGAALLSQSDRSGALAAFEQAAVLAPSNPLPHIALGRIHAGQQQYKDAEKSFAKALNLQTNMPDIMLERADVLVLDQRLDEAIAAYQATAKVAPKNVAVPVKLGMALQQAGKTPAAFGAYEQALKLAPNAPLVFNNLTVLAIESKTRLKEADAWSAKAVDLAPKVASYLDTRAWLLQATGRGKEAIAMLDAGISRMEPSAQLHYRRGLLLEESGQITQAVDAYRQALSVDLNFAAAKDAGSRIKKLAVK